MKLSDETYEYIKQEVIDLFVRYNIKCVPISGFELAKKIGIILIPYSGLNTAKRSAAQTISMDGFYWEPGDGKEYILYEDSANYRRQNMTILHEIAHGVLGHDDNTDPKVAEAEAGFFAKYAIAPPPLVHRIKPSKPEEIQEFFSISYQAACNAFNYYQKWLYCGRSSYEDYEIVLLNQIVIMNRCNKK